VLPSCARSIVERDPPPGFERLSRIGGGLTPSPPPTPPDIRVTHTAIRSLQHGIACQGVGGSLPTAASRPVGHPVVQATRSEPVRPFRPSARWAHLPCRLLTPLLGSVRLTLHSSPLPWHATSLGTAEASRGKRSSHRCRDAGCIKHRPRVDGGLHGRVPACPDGTTPRIQCVPLALHLRSTLPSDAPSRGRPCPCSVAGPKGQKSSDRRFCIKSSSGLDCG
jgi:hypothetical protein